MIKTNFHTHTKRCHHASGLEQDYLLSALDNQLNILGFSDHGPYIENTHGFHMDFSEMETYIENITHLKARYKNQITLYCGFEYEFLPEHATFYEQILARNDVDYFALGQHFFTSSDGMLVSTYDLPDTASYLTYASSVITAISTGYYKFIAHPDLMFINDFTWDKNCDIASEMIVTASVKHNCPLELNANGLRRGLTTFCDGVRYPYPVRKFWDYVAAAKIPVIINSDCHEPSALWDSQVALAHKLAQEWNLTVVSSIF